MGKVTWPVGDHVQQAPSHSSVSRIAVADRSVGQLGMNFEQPRQLGDLAAVDRVGCSHDARIIGSHDHHRLNLISAELPANGDRL